MMHQVKYLQTIGLLAQRSVPVLVTSLVFFLASGFCLKPQARAGVSGELGVAQEHYLGRPEGLYGVKDYSLISARLNANHQSQYFAFALSAGALAGFTTEDQEFGLLKNYATVYAPEVYLQARQSDVRFFPAEVTFGRKKEPWSQLDEDWQLGIWQPLFRWDYLRPESQGLTGFFLTWKAEGAEIGFFWSPLFLPEQGPSFQIVEGRIDSRSPWFSEPANSAVLFSQPTPIQYTVATPAVSDVIEQNSFGLRFTVGDADKVGIYSRGSYAYKPRNSLSLPFEAPLITTPTNQTVQVTVYPQVERHHLGAFDLGVQSELVGVSLAALAEFPENKRVDANLNRQELDPQILISPTIRTQFWRERSWGPRVSLSYLHQNGGETTELGPVVEISRGEVFGPRLSWTRAIQVQIESVLIQKEVSSLNFKFRWLEDFDQRGSLVSTELRWKALSHLQLMLAGDVLGSRAASRDQSGLINRYRGNDRIIGGVAYVF